MWVLVPLGNCRYLFRTVCVLYSSRANGKMNEAGRVKAGLSLELFESCFTLFPSASCFSIAPPSASSAAAGTSPEDEAGGGRVGFPLSWGAASSFQRLSTEVAFFVRDLGQATCLRSILPFAAAVGWMLTVAVRTPTKPVWPPGTAPWLCPW